MEDKRKFLRFDVSLDARSKTPGWFRPRSRYAVKDVSREGLKLSSKEALKNGDVLELELSMPTKRSPITALSQVMWSHKKSDSDYDIGLKFKTIKPEEKFELLDYAFDKWVESKKQQG
jgi:hypothetical protein